MTSNWVLSLVYWLHMLATVVWIGGLAALSIFVLPAARRTLDATAYLAFLVDLQRRLDPLGWFSLAVLAGTGMIQMGANPNYQGFLVVEHRWAIAILVKHLCFLVMVALSAYLTWGLLPALRRTAMRQGGGLTASEGRRLQKRENLLLKLNLFLGILILALTAVARAS